MIISLRRLSYEDLKKQLDSEDKIVIVTCDACIKACGIGGHDMTVMLQEMLRSSGYSVLGRDVIGIGCNLTLVEKHRNDKKKSEMYDAATAIISLICEDGFEGIHHQFRDKKVIGIAKTVGIGNYTIDRGVVLTHPFESTGLERTPEGYALPEIAEKLNLFGGFFDNTVDEQSREYVTLTVDGQKIKALKDQNLLVACNQNGINVPQLCFHEGLSESGACRMCLVKISGQEDLTAACCTRVQDGMEVITEDTELNHYRRVILELIMASGDHNCLTCSKGLPTPLAACKLQDLIRQVGIENSRYDTDDSRVQSVDDSSPVLFYDPCRCILCGRCVRACEEVAGPCNLGFINRSGKTVVAAGADTQFNESACAGCMACVNVCPTGALNEKFKYFSGDDWEPVRKYMVW